ncbi:MAG: HD domain-containing protein [Acidobacteria bacterium]|nr:HD domain-containing protein [Acidobacteriota bacterium]
MTAGSRAVDEMWEQLQARIRAVANPWLRRLLESVVMENAERLRKWPAALTVHHAYAGGLLEHILKVAEVGQAVAVAYAADPDLVLAGAVLHDIGKLEELHHDDVTTYTREGNLIGHITLGVMIVRQAASAIPSFPSELRAHLEHLVVSHHGDRKLGSPVEPMTTEAFILSAVDDLDATLFQVQQHLTQDGDPDAGEGEFTAYHPRLRRVLFRRGVR